MIRTAPLSLRKALRVVHADGQYTYMNRVNGLYWFYTNTVGVPGGMWWNNPTPPPGVFGWTLHELRVYARNLIFAGRVEAHV